MGAILDWCRIATALEGDHPTIYTLPSIQNARNSCRDFSHRAKDGTASSARDRDMLIQRKNLLKCPWTPPKDYCFSVQTNLNLRFQISMVDIHTALTRSPLSILCFVRRRSSREMKSPAPWIPCDKSIYKLGNSLECFSEHAKTSYRQKCSEFAENFLRVAQGQQQPILNQLSNERDQQDAEHRVILGSIVDKIILCGRQELALRGKHGAGTVKTQVTEINDGNFRSLLRFRVQAGDSVLEKPMESGAKIQKKINDICGDIIKEHIVHKLNEAKCFAVLVDEITHIRTVEQLSLCVRWLGDFLSFTPVKDLTGQRIAETIIAALKHHGIHCSDNLASLHRLRSCVRFRKHALLGPVIKGCPPPPRRLKTKEEDDPRPQRSSEANQFYEIGEFGYQSYLETGGREVLHHNEYLIGQGYDSASSMSGYLHRAQAYVRKGHPVALDVHCSAHSLNLALAESCSLPAIRNHIGTVQPNVCKNSATLKETIKEFLRSSAHSNLLVMYETRWVYKHETVLRFKEMYEPIVQSLLKIKEIANKEASQKTHQLYCAIIQIQFVVTLNTLNKIFLYTLALCKFLQTVNSDLAAVLRFVDDVVTTLDELRGNTHEFNGIYKASSLMFEKVGEKIMISRIVTRSVHRANVPTDSTEEHFKKNLYLPFVDHVRTQLKERFQHQKSLTTAIQKIIPAHSNDATKEELRICAEFDKTILPEHSIFDAEFSIWKNKWLKEDPKSRPANALDAFAIYVKHFFTNVKKLLQVIATLPVSTATPERTFPTSRRLKTYLRNSVGEMRLTGLALLSVHRCIQVKTEVVSRILKMPRRIFHCVWYGRGSIRTRCLSRAALELSRRSHCIDPVIIRLEGREWAGLDKERERIKITLNKSIPGRSN
ncbi:hypothetical protein PR048_002794, partial [Dryococelus australis]